MVEFSQMMSSMLLKTSFCYPLALATLATATLVQSASAATFNFSFSNVNGPVNGTVEGTITLPDGDGTFAATSVIVTSAPAALGYTLPLDAFFGLFFNSFTVSGGAITASSFLSGPSGGLFSLSSPFGGTYLTTSNNSSASSGVLDSSNSTLTSTPAPSAAVPEPATVLGLLSVAGVGFLSKRQKSAK